MGQSNFIGHRAAGVAELGIYIPLGCVHHAINYPPTTTSNFNLHLLDITYALV